jgi:hypothetical protein
VCSDDRWAAAVGACDERCIPVADGAGVQDGRPCELERGLMRVVGRADIVPVEDVLAERRVPLCRRRRKGRIREPGRCRMDAEQRLTARSNDPHQALTGEERPR